ncbi:MAG: hypothetical protein KC668_21425 [Myxococcales bacterium]|nr:hypothetical protein [Myxococcales bacterium]
MAITFVSPPLSARAERGSVSFAGPQGCAEQTLDQALRRYLERAPEDAAVPDDVTVRVVARASGRGFVLTLDVQRADGATTHRRVRHARRCDLLLETAALIAALAIDPDVAGRHVTGPDVQPGPDVPPNPEPDPVDAAAEPAGSGVDGTELGSAVGDPSGATDGVAEPEPDPGDAATEPADPTEGEADPEPGPDASDPAQAHPLDPGHAVTAAPPDAGSLPVLPPEPAVQLALGVGATMAFHLYPATAGGVQLTVALLRRRMRVELRLALLGLRHVGLGEPGWNVRVLDYGGDAVGCYAPRRGAWSVPVCGLFGVAGESARASAQVPQAGRATRTRVSLGQRVGVRWAPRRRHELGLDVEVSEQLLRPVFGVAGTDRLVRAQRVAYRASVTWAAVWP